MGVARQEQQGRFNYEQEIALSLQEAYLGIGGSFLPKTIPYGRWDLPSFLEPFTSLWDELPKRYTDPEVGARIWLDDKFRDADPGVTEAILRLNEPEREGVMTLFSTLAHVYRRGSIPAKKEISDERQINLPAGIASPWGAVAKSLGLPRVGTAWTLHHLNWQMRDGTPGGSVYEPEKLRAECIEVLYNPLPSPLDESFSNFSTSFVMLEAFGKNVHKQIAGSVEKAADQEIEGTIDSLGHLQVAIQAMVRSFGSNMRERSVDSNTWLNMVQPTFAWSAETDITGQIHGGPSGLQVPTIQALNEFFGISKETRLGKQAQAARLDMPREHRKLLELLEKAGKNLRLFIEKSDVEALKSQFNNCLDVLQGWHRIHLHKGNRALSPEEGVGEGVPGSTGLNIEAGSEDGAGTFRELIDEVLAAINNARFKEK